MSSGLGEVVLAAVCPSDGFVVDAVMFEAAVEDADAIYLWAFTSLNASPGARCYYDARRAAGDGHHQALRALGNRLVGILHGCLEHHSVYDETIGWAHRGENNLTQAA